ncbi:MAG: DNA-directed RNA polymerase subunit beta [Planctomycetes bacterium]|nr:DNA-directed RNA polymerase subunit beta [Planctomycetota bacterium]
MGERIDVDTQTTKSRFYGQVKEILPVPSLMDLQIKSFDRFLQRDLPAADRESLGLQGLIKEVFPIKSYDGSLTLEFIQYDLGSPRYTPDECRQLRLTYGYPFKITVRLDKPDPIEEDVYLGEIPVMVGGGEFIINGAERVIVSQLHRSPGVDFSEEVQAGEKRLHSCRIIPERGSWIELTVNKKDHLTVRIDQSGKFSATTLLRAMSPEYSTHSDIVRLFYSTERVSTSSRDFAAKVATRIIVEDLVNPETGEVLLDAGEAIPERLVPVIKGLSLDSIEVISGADLEHLDHLVLHSLREDTTRTHEEALLKIYQRLRPGNPPQLEKARELFYDKFFNPNKYRLGRVGRFRLNRKFGQSIPESHMVLDKEDYVNAIRYLVSLRTGGKAGIDDIDHLGNRRVRTIDELAADEFRKGFLKLRRTVQERMSLMDQEQLTPRSIINSKTISSSIDFFFGRGELSQVVDQTNPLAQLTHERRLSALGPGGLNRKRAGFEVRDVHISHYGRICPIETPEGTNIGLISSLGIYATIDEYGFLVTPYREVKEGRITRKIRYLRADEEDNRCLAPADTAVDKDGKIVGKMAMARINGDFKLVRPEEVEFLDVSPKQLVGVSAALIPFLEHDDANRALMGSNMQRQAVPLLRTQPPIVATGMERDVARNSGMVVTAKNDGVVLRATATEIIVGDDEYRLRKFVGLNERTFLNQRPIVREGQFVKRGDVIADGAATHEGELALGKNVLVAFMPFDGYNFEDAILISENLLKDDRFTSIHIDEFEIEIRETNLGREEFTRDIPNVSERALRNLDESGIVRIGTRVGAGDILVGKVVPKSKTELSPEEKLLHAIFGRAGEDVKNDSLEVRSGVEGMVIGAKKFARKTHFSEDEKKRNQTEIRETNKDYNGRIKKMLKDMFAQIDELLGEPLRDRRTKEPLDISQILRDLDIPFLRELLRIDNLVFKKNLTDTVQGVIRKTLFQVSELDAEKNRVINKLVRGDELPTGVLEMVKVYVSTKRKLSVGDKMAGRHGNKGVIARVLPQEDMPFLADGTPVEIVLNPLGVPSRMNVGQILETHLGWAANVLGFQALTPVFDGCREEQIREVLREAGLPEDGKVVLHDGRSGEPFEQKVTVGYLYMMKLHHLVDEKVHARATGPYSLITQQPLGGKARFGGQRFGEMEVWALEAYGAASVLQELLTVKSDDVDGRTKIYESMVKGENTLEPGTPISFDVLTNEIKGLGLNMVLNKKKV